MNKYTERIPEYGASTSVYQYIRDVIKDEECTDEVMITLSIDRLADVLEGWEAKVKGHYEVLEKLKAKHASSSFGGCAMGTF